MLPYLDNLVTHHLHSHRFKLQLNIICNAGLIALDNSLIYLHLLLLLVLVNVILQQQVKYRLFKYFKTIHYHQVQLKVFLS